MLFALKGAIKVKMNRDNPNHPDDPDGVTRASTPGNPSNQNPGWNADPDGVTMPYLPPDDPGSVDPNGATVPYLPEDPQGYADPYGATQVPPAGSAYSYYYNQNDYNQSSPVPPDPNYPPAPYETQPYIPGQDPLSQYQPIQPGRGQPQRPFRRAARRRRRGFGCAPGCGCLSLILPVLVLLAAYFLAPLRTNLLVLGLDRAPEGTSLSRTDTIMLVSVNPLLPDVKMLSIPRDLWISIPGYGENRINTVHFFAEGQEAGSGPRITMQVIRDTFQVPLSYYVRVRFDAVTGIVDAMGGVDVNMPEAMSGYEAGLHHLDGKQALAFARDRKNTDDFFRMAHGQLLVKSIVAQTINPLTWWRIPQMVTATFQVVDTNLPFWQWPRIGVALARAVIFGGIDNRTLDREMATPFVTNEGAQVLIPHWDLIAPLVRQMFG